MASKVSTGGAGDMAACSVCSRIENAWQFTSNDYKYNVYYIC